MRYQLHDEEMYRFFKRVCEKNWKRSAKICKECPFKGYIACASQTYAFRMGLDDPLEGIDDV